MSVSAQTLDTIRYVHPTRGLYTNDGKSWETAKNNVQDAINDLHEYLQQNGLTGGSVYIASGRYVPTESTESTGGTMLNTSFKIYGGIHVFGGFNADNPESTPGERKMINGKTWDENWASRVQIGPTTEEQVSAMWDFQYETVLSGNHSPVGVKFQYDSIRGRYSTSYPASSYHVVWFATNGIIPVTNDSLANHYRPLDHTAWVDGCVIRDGNASNRTIAYREHMSYGGGAYMVGNSELRHCKILYCSATMRGGGVYLDGGGRLDFCYVNTCQVLGVGIVQGYGGGVCIDYDGSVDHTFITQCSARVGAGLSICHVPGEYPWSERGDAEQVNAFSPFCAASLISNNTSTAEGAGIYLDEGGTVNHCTVVRNNCIGPDVTYYGRRHGRSGGIYVRNNGMIYNSVLWGNACAVNNNIQFASVRQDKLATDTVYVYHTGVMNHDITDWTNVSKESVFNLERVNMPIQGSTGNFPAFDNPTPLPGILCRTKVNGEYADSYPNVYPEYYPHPRRWHPTIYSALAEKGVQVTDAVQVASQWIFHAHCDYGIVGNNFEPVSSVGCLVRENENVHYTLVAPQSWEGINNSTPIPTVFVDPNRKAIFDNEGNYIVPDSTGVSWKRPLVNIGDAVIFFRNHLVDDREHDTIYYRLPEYDSNGNLTGGTVDYPYVQILVKEGTLTTAGRGNYIGEQMRTASIRILSHMRMYGGYPKENTEISTANRNPYAKVTRITANIAGGGSATSYANNSAHVIAFINTQKAVVDGFRLHNGNSHFMGSAASMQAGAGVLVNNTTIEQSKRVDMVGNVLRNCVLANNTAPKGAAIYVNGEHPKSDGTVSYAELTVTNCVIRNNTASEDTAQLVSGGHGIITANGRAFVDVNHCTVANNVGYPFKADSKTTVTNQPITCPHPEHNYHSFQGYIRVNNSLVFCNGYKILDDRTGLGSASDSVTSVYPPGEHNVFGTYNMFDSDIALHKKSDSRPFGFFDSSYSLSVPNDFVPDGFDKSWTQTSLAADRHNQAVFTRTDRTQPTYPVFVNPSRNVGHSFDNDKPLYGGTVSYMPLNQNPCVNAADPDAPYRHTAVDVDRSGVVTRDFGGAPDIGAIENTNLPRRGAVIYVTPDGAGKRDGSSWSNAIAGNTIYALNNAPAAVAEGDADMLDEANGTTRIIHTAGNSWRSVGAANGVLTTDTKYQGGYAMEYVYPVFTDSSFTYSRVCRKARYTGGSRDGEEVVFDIDTVSVVENAPFLYNNGKIPDYWTSALAVNKKYPYGEMSGVSRYVYRAFGNYSPLSEDGNKVMLDGSVPANTNAAMDALTASGRLVLTNERIENYVSGLQYAVETASQFNKSIHKDSVQVWVGAGKYTDYKGYIMRDSVSVYGGFPTGKYASPGLTERRALMSAVVSIPKSIKNKDLDPEDYETILQISDVNPKQSNKAINTEAIKFKDNGRTIQANIDNHITYLSDHNIVDYYRMAESAGDVDRTSWLLYPDFTNNSVNVTNSPHDEGVTAGLHYYRFGEADGSKDCWHLSFPEKTNYVATIENSANTNNKQRDIYNPLTDSRLTGADASYTGNWIFICNGSLTGLQCWQEMPYVQSGNYRLSVDIAGGYRNKFSCADNTNIFLRIYDANGACVESVMIKSVGDITHNDDRDQNRSIAYRYVLSFNQPVNGKLRIAVEVEDGVRNTVANGASSPTGSGGDPDPIPDAYANSYGVSNPNRREFWMSDIKLYHEAEAGDYILDRSETEDVIDTITITNITEKQLLASKQRNVLRKRVLQMPDVTATTYIHSLGAINGNGKYEDKLHHYERVVKEGRLSNLKENGTLVNGRHQDPNYKEYNNVYWDGFTIRHGFITDQRMAHGGGAGVCMYEGARLVNCVVTDNWAGAGGVKGGGVFCDGSTSTIENCFILNNTSTQGNANNSQGQQQAGGLFLYEGTCFNTLIANNYANGPGGGLGLCVGKFYNNTVAYNTTGYADGNANCVGGVRIAVGSDPAIFMANTIIYGNQGLALSVTSGSAKTAPFINCYVQSKQKITLNNFINALTEHAEGVTDGFYGRNNTFLNGVSPDAANTPFGADVVNGTYTAGAQAANDFSLREKDSVTCINAGEEDFDGAMYEAVRTYLRRNNAAANPTDAAIRKESFYKNVVGVKLPENDVVFADRIQDCQVDIGAYEYDAALSIRPDTITRPGRAIFYVAFKSPGGDASGRTPEDAACSMKLQKVLDAAGRYKHELMTNRAGAAEGNPDETWMVEVRLEGDSNRCTIDGDYLKVYSPTRSTKFDNENITDNTLDYSFIVPHGVQVKGGYSGTYYVKDSEGYYLDAAGERIAQTNLTDEQKRQRVDQRDPLTYRSVFSGETSSITGATGNTYHVVTFTNNLYEALSEKTIDEGDQLSSISGEQHRAVLDGLFIENGYANSPDSVDRIGGAAVVTGYAHIKNCVVQNNQAQAFGGGLYLLPNALVSGTIVKNNIANQGGGIYVEQPDVTNYNTYAHIYTSTICGNTANTTGGGLYFLDNARVNSSAIWHNRSNDFANLVGQFGFTNEGEAGYPLTYTAVEVRKIEGTGNIELSALENEGVRWDHNDPFDRIMYYPLNAASILASTGMSYEDYREVMLRFPTLDSIDIALVSRTRWDVGGVKRDHPWNDTLVIKNNEYIDIGARAINHNFENIKDSTLVMYRLFVANSSTDWNSQEEFAVYRDSLISNKNTDPISNMYRQRGSSFYYPFQSLTLALDYIIDMRTKFPALNDARFEIFVGGRGRIGDDYMPERTAHNQKEKGRTNTFVVPERVSIVGSIDYDPRNKDSLRYCQSGYQDIYSANSVLQAGLKGDTVVTTSSGFKIKMSQASSIDICNRRRLTDMNNNDVYEPWEFAQPSILSGEIRKEDGTILGNAYHVITCYADATKLGGRPTKYKTFENGEFKDPITQESEYNLECEASRVARTIIIDGLTIQRGQALNIDSVDTISTRPYLSKTYFRGGGIFVDGNWTKDFDVDDGNIPNVTDKANHNIPLLIRNCWFHGNIGGNGGAIYSNGNLHIYGSYFTQNYSQGPMSELDQKRIPWSAGGCIATNGFCAVLNCLFANNEAKRGKFPIIAESSEYIEDAEVRQGFAGVISAAADAQVNAMNTHFVRNKAVAYPVLFNFESNDYYDPEVKDYMFNSIFWGNEATGITRAENSSSATTETKAEFAEHYDARKNDLMHYDADKYAEYHRLLSEYDAIVEQDDYVAAEADDKLQDLRGVADDIEGIYFSAYEKGRALEPAKPRADYLLKSGESYFDARSKEVKPSAGGNYNIGGDISLAETFTYLRGNHNVLIDSDNNAVNGPHFVQPTLQAGNNDAVQLSDWLLSRINATTDAGWGFLLQNVTRDTIGWSISEDTGIPATRYDTEQEAENHLSEYSGDAFVYAVLDGVENAMFRPDRTDALYNHYANRTTAAFLLKLMPLGAERYMEYIRYDEATNRPMHRISSNPRMGTDKVFIDMGVYEYQFVNLCRAGAEIDTMWITADERGMFEDQTIEHDGSSWARATSNIQGAIDRLLESHNNHDKYICFKEGNYAPITEIGHRLAFVIQSPTNHLAIHLPDNARNDEDYYVKSLTFLGGYSLESADDERDPEKHPVVFEMPDKKDRDILNQLFVVDDVTRLTMQRTFRADDLKRTDAVIPITFDGLTFHNIHSVSNKADAQLNRLGGGAIFYREQRKYELDGNVLHRYEDVPLRPDSVVYTNDEKIELPKLTLSNCIFADNGVHSGDSIYRSPAVYIGQGGGSTLVVNSLFHSNAGKPLYAPNPTNIDVPAIAAVPNKVTVVNSTFALNDGHLTMDWEGSELHNSIIWRDDEARENKAQFEINKVQWKPGSDQIGIKDQVTRNAIYGFVESDTLDNENLIRQNGDLFQGPNFVNPDTSATTEQGRMARDFHLKPAVRTMNRADSSVYRNRVFVREYHTAQYPELGETTYWRRPLGVKYPITTLRNDSDLASKPRFHGEGMERGAYECLVVLRRVMYVDPSHFDGEGSSWIDAFGQNQLQDAIDAAAIYTYMNREVGNIRSRRSYVFVKGAVNKYEPAIIPRAGVQIYGSIPASFQDTAVYDPVSKKYENDTCEHYVNRVVALRSGIATPRAITSKLRGVQSDLTLNEAFTTDFVLDGFEITNSTDVCDNPVINLTNERAVIRNSLIRSNLMNNQPVAQLSNGLLYNTLVYNNDAPVQVAVSDNGLVLNCTVIADDNDSTIDATNALPKAVVNTLTLNETKNTTARMGTDAFSRINTDYTAMFADNLRPTFAYPKSTLAPHLLAPQYQQLWYQLHDRSRAIEAGANASWFSSIGQAANALDAQVNTQFAKYDSVINYSRDRDVLGNPRLIGDTVDLGCFETWNVEDSATITATAETDNIFTTNYGGHDYPHIGSVVYINRNATLHIPYSDAEEYRFTIDNALQPAYLLVKDGGSLYADGNYIRAEYVAVEKIFNNQQYSMTALPYAYSITNAITHTYDATTDSLKTRPRNEDFSGYYYSGSDRAKYNYVFQLENSYAWHAMTNDSVRANDGWLLDFGSTHANDTILFTSWTDKPNTWLYIEDGNPKEVILNQYDHRNDGMNGGGMDFTRLEDMGWNMRGMPYLVSDYATYPYENGTYQMQIPHLFYQMSGAGEYTHIVDSREQINTLQSWADGAVMTLGNAWFTQTADIDDTENLIFKQPLFANKPSRAPRSCVLLANENGRGDLMDVIPDSMANKIVNYKMGRDGVKWQTNNHLQVWLIDEKKNMPISLLASAPVEVDMSVGVAIPADGTYSFSLPTPEGFEPYSAVWLKDLQTNHVTNLLQGAYEFEALAGQDTKRFKLRIGGIPLGTDKNREYIVFSHQRNLYLRGLMEGDDIRVYSADGKMVTRLTAAQTEYVIPLPQGMFAVSINDYNKKVITR